MAPSLEKSDSSAGLSVVLALIAALDPQKLVEPQEQLAKRRHATHKQLSSLGQHAHDQELRAGQRSVRAAASKRQAAQGSKMFRKGLAGDRRPHRTAVASE
mmetsp:Transcript_8600/g.24502  ORF Transcript_8600/g.24502 Transcript_8600/m.24502 type:complete len:101 (-) Transcript_8600:526-828(-)|eukprot:CAMPEP_0118972598 /NCGR_PEP_ID=MMETSP1173-20130426/8861_1 /TAXON_ID=1034831 /ORGANISM="Rhizochromulina marina cf, Strain CCMP1243" /LENGTH=100 /DNA_ID=CAMNT_0006922159 /DNA_START=111 /DNA_END=413 /DNA_ORIENTATION=+